MRYIIGFLMVLFSSNAMADQLVVKERVFRGGYSYVLNVDNTEMCLRTITNISDLKKHSDVRTINALGKFYAKEFLCITEDGIVSEYGFVYQIPFSKEDEMCIRWRNWDGFNLTEECKEDGFTTQAVIFKGSLNQYVEDQK